MNHESIDDRAIAIHAEKRSEFHLGPPPYTSALTVDHKASAMRWTIQVSKHFPTSAYLDVLDVLAKLSTHGDPNLMAYGLAWFEAANEAGRNAAKGGEEQ